MSEVILPEDARQYRSREAVVKRAEIALILGNLGVNANQAAQIVSELYWLGWDHGYQCRQQQDTE